VRPPLPLSDRVFLSSGSVAPPRTPPLTTAHRPPAASVAPSLPRRTASHRWSSPLPQTSSIIVDSKSPKSSQTLTRHRMPLPPALIRRSPARSRLCHHLFTLSPPSLLRVSESEVVSALYSYNPRWKGVTRNILSATNHTVYSYIQYYRLYFNFC
jgi:hypothetical protein